ncbi:MAG: L,D-transpeptidase family protein [Rickettsiales bacterium]|nr:L,D-transpeptidase family protein [Rickettsiales bacterium]
MGLDILVLTDSELSVGERRFRCAVGSGGFIDEALKREGDKKTPIGAYPLRECWYREDKIPEPRVNLPLKMIQKDDGWCDAPDDLNYNRHVKLPYQSSHETLWRADHAYDLIIPVGYNDAPIEPGKGSAIFMHIAQPDYRGTEGCVVLSHDDWLQILPQLDTESRLIIRPSGV